LIRWIGYNRDGILPDMAFGLHYSIINIIPYIIDDLIYNNIAKWASIFVFPLLVSFTEYLFEFSWFANHNVFAYALRNNIHIIQICSLFGCYFLSFIIALFASIVDYSHNVYKKEKKISKFVYYYAIIILLITSFGSIRLLIPEKAERFNVAAALGVYPPLYEEGNNTIPPIDEYMNYIEKTIIKANSLEAKVIVYSEEAFALYSPDRNEMISRTAKLSEKYNIYVVLPMLVGYDNYYKNEAVFISNKGEVLYNYEKRNISSLLLKNLIK
jgi:apolipoprotein N-acyltransferase